MKTSLPTLFAFLITITTHSQVISMFNWESGAVTQAVSGPNAISVSSSAVISAYGISGKGLNPGNPKKDIDLVLPGSPWFDVPGIDISIVFRREESQASFFKRGNHFDFGMEGGKLNMKFQVSNGSGGGTLVNAANVYTIPDDHVFHTYRFVYDSYTGVAQLSVDGTVVYTYTGTAGRPLYWNGGNVVIGAMADATGNSVAIFDNMLVQHVPVPGSLPVKLTSFTAQPRGKEVAIQWTATNELHFKHFVVERSADGISYAALATVDATGGLTPYGFKDAFPLSPVGYYRLKMVDVDGTFSYSDVRTVSVGQVASSISCFPNPAKDHFNIRMHNTAPGQYRYSVVSMQGKVMEAKVVALGRGEQRIVVYAGKAMPAGMYVVEVECVGTGSKQAFTILKG